MKYSFWLFSTCILLSCQQDSSAIKELFSLPKKLKEVSGITYLSSSKLIWTLEDSGNSNSIYALNEKGELLKKLTIENTKNVDWEDITKDDLGNVYIGDFGNNDNERKDLVIYKVAKEELNKKEAKSTSKIEFSYPEQTDFPPKKTKMLYDVEGFFEFENAFYLFTKNRSKNFDGTALLYKVLNKAGKQKAVLMGEFKTCANYNHCAITSAAISPDKSKVVVLCHDKVILFENFKNDDFLSGKKTTLSLGHFSQKEAVVFKDNQTLLIADEKTKKIGGKMYEFSLK